jgi:hypothetical protein
MRQLFNQCKDKNKFVYEVCEVFGDKITIEEMDYWFAFDILQAASTYSLNVREMTFEDTLDEIEKQNNERKRKWQPKRKRGSLKKEL